MRLRGGAGWTALAARTLLAGATAQSGEAGISEDAPARPGDGTAARGLDDAARGFSTRYDLLWLIALLVVGFAARLAVAVLFPSIHHPDETFQYWEQGFRLATGSGIVPWEYRDGVRSWIVPGVIGGIIAIVQAFGGTEAVWRIAVQALFAATSLSIVATAFLWGRQLAGLGGALLAGLTASLWFEFLYFSAKPLTEVLAAAALFPAAFLLCALPAPTRRARMLGGALLGLALVLRFHLAPAILLIAAVHMVRTPVRQWWPQLIAGVLVVLASGMLDWMTWGTPFQSIWLNFHINVIEGRAASYGSEPVAWYLFDLARTWSWLTPVLVVLVLIGARKAPLLLAVPLVLLISHSLIAHKEARFLYPMLPFVLTLASIGAAEIITFATRSLNVIVRRTVLLLAGSAIVMSSAALAASTAYRHNFFVMSGPIAVFRNAGEIEKICGLGVGGQPWAFTPGLSGLGRAVPFYWLQSTADGERLQSAFNVLVYDSDDWPEPKLPFLGPTFCSGDMCVARRLGGCEPHPDDEVNAVLERIGQ